jgi:hypothetical protein
MCCNRCWAALRCSRADWWARIAKKVASARHSSCARGVEGPGLRIQVRWNEIWQTILSKQANCLCRGLGEEQEGWYDEVWVIFFLPCYRFLRFSGCVSIKRHFVGANLGIDRLMAFWRGEVRRLDFARSSVSAVVCKKFVSRLFLRFFQRRCSYQIYIISIVIERPK